MSAALCSGCGEGIEPADGAVWAHTSGPKNHPAVPSDRRSTREHRYRENGQQAIGRATAELGDYVLLNQFDPQGRLTPDKLFNDRRK